MKETMKALVVVDKEKIELREVEKPVPAAGEILIRLEECLICTWELRIFKNGAGMPFPFLPGHEVSGIVEFVPPETTTSFKKGDPVVVKTLDSCGHCEFCYQGFDNQCVGQAKKRYYDGIPGTGGLAQFIALPPQRVYPLPDFKGDFSSAAFAEPIACCLHSLEQAQLKMGENVVVVGGGIMGQLHSLLAQKSGARTILVEPEESRRTLALQTGTSVAIDPLSADPVADILALTGGQGAQVVFITAPLPSLPAQYVPAMTKMGRMVLYSSFHPDTEVGLSPNHIHYSEKVITGSFSPSSKGFYLASRLLGYGLIDTTPFLSGIFPMEEAEQAFAMAASPTTMRVCIKLWE